MFLSLTRVPILLSLTIALPFNSVANAQTRSREEVLKEAGRIVTEAERKVGEAHKTVQAGGDRKLIADAERGVAESLVKAIELWREAGDDRHLIAGLDELTRLYSVHGNYQELIDRLMCEANYWLERGNSTQQIDTLYTLGIRQWQMGRDAAATETIERVIQMSRSNGLYQLERNALEQLANLYDKAGRAKDAESSRSRAKELWAIREAVSVNIAQPLLPPPTIPAQWIDLPSAPLAAEYRDVNGVNQAVLVNKSTKGIELVMFGCVAVEDNSKTRVLYGLIGLGRNHGGVGPGSYYEPFAALNGPLNRWTDEKMGCEGAAKMAVIEARFADRTIWKTDIN